MTVQEAAYRYGVKEYQTSEGDSLHSIIVALYGDYSDVYYIVLKTLNLRFDWFSLPAGEKIKYLTKIACQQVYEVPSVKLTPKKVSRRISSSVSYKDIISQEVYKDEIAER